MYFPSIIKSGLTATSRAGVTVVAPVTPGDEGAYTVLITNTAQESEGGLVVIRELGAAGVDSHAHLDLAYGDVSGGNEVNFYTNLLAGLAASEGSTATLGRQVPIFPYIPAARDFVARLRSVVASESITIAPFLFMGGVHLEDIGVATTYGADEDVGDISGTQVTCGNGAFGSWTLIGTVSGGHNILLPNVDAAGSGAISERDIIIKLGFGSAAPGSGGTEIDAIWGFKQTSGEAMTGLMPSQGVYAVVANGLNIYACAASGGTDIIGVSVLGMTGTAISGGGSTLIPMRSRPTNLRR